MITPHAHKDSAGFVHLCYHKCRHWVNPKFILGLLVAQTLPFPLEHLLWEKLWPFYYLTHLLGL
jgi:hypothetical protein